MAKAAASIGGKRLISLAPDAWVQWVTQQPEVVAREILASEFQWVSRENDVLMKAYSPAQGEFLFLTELQRSYTLRMPKRMRAYAALAEEKYALTVYPVLVNILQPHATVTISDRYSSNFLGLQARQDYRVINLWEVDAGMVFERSLSTLIPFVPVLQGGNEAAMVQRAVQVWRQDEQLSELEPLLAFFASFVLDTELIRQILRWDMAVLRESPWYQEILQEGQQQEGRALILEQLDHRLGAVPADLQAKIQALSLPQLKALGIALLDFSEIDDLIAWLQVNQQL